MKILSTVKTSSTFSLRTLSDNFDFNPVSGSSYKTFVNSLIKSVLSLTIPSIAGKNCPGTSSIPSKPSEPNKDANTSLIFICCSSLAPLYNSPSFSWAAVNSVLYCSVNSTFLASICSCLVPRASAAPAYWLNSKYFFLYFRYFSL